MKPVDYLRDCEGGVAIQSSVGYGTFINFEIKKAGEDVKLWIYLAEWAILIGDREVIASDMNDQEFSKNRDCRSILDRQEIMKMELVDHNEVHIHFSSGFRIEIWRDLEKYEQDDPLIRIFRQGQHVADF